ncbi:glycogen/starch synthase, partial [Rhizobium sp. RAF56]|uniref:glycogen/starch synthase n=1 Tax=Rhizobium sp. RAF56 TaxID=3233062 RepID=UPI003F9B4EE2
MKVLSVTSEIFPLVKTGGLADVTGSLPNALSEFEVETVSLVPGYPGVMARLRNVATVATMDLFGAEARILRADSEGLDLFVLDIPVLYDRPGGPYLDEQGIDFADNSRRFAALSLGGALIADGAITDWKPDLVHTHDWQSALTSVYLRYRLKSSLPT